MDNLVWMALLTVFFLVMLVLDLGSFTAAPTISPAEKPQSGEGSGLHFPSRSVSACGKERKVEFSSSPAIFWKSRFP
jgi:hypothetical protein